MSLYDYFLFACTGVYLVVLAVFCVRRRQPIPSGWFGVALLAWPLLMLPEFFSLLGLRQYIVAASSMLCWVPVMIMTAIYLTVRKLVVHVSFPPPRLIWLPAFLTLFSQLPVMVIALTEGFTLYNTPVGAPLQYWYLYQTYLVAGLSMMALGIMATEDVQQYHYYLGDQVVDAGRYRLHRLTGVLATSVTVALVCILLVTVTALGFATVPWWQTFYHLVTALMLLIMIIVMTVPVKSSPSVLEYPRLEQRRAEPNQLNATFAKAQQAVIEHKAYKIIGLRIADVATMAKVDPTDLAIATRVLKNCSFRGWIYHYRLEYAKNVLLRSDAKLATVARRLGLNSEKFLSEVLVKHLSRAHD